MLIRKQPKSARRAKSVLTNTAIAALLAAEADNVNGHVQRAYRRAARNAFVWTEEAADLVTQGRSLTELPGIGPHLEKILLRWIENPPPIPEATEAVDLTSEFLTFAEARRILATDPSFAKKYCGDLHMHSNWSDGSGTIAELAAAAITRGYAYIAVADHSKGLKIAGGITEAQLAEQAEEIREVNESKELKQKQFRVLKGLELNLNPRGEGDMDEEALRNLDIVVGSFHSALRVTTDQTDRYLAALRNPMVNILGHPRGRVYNYRAGLTANWRKVFAEAARLDKAVEVNSYPDRQDLNMSLLKIVREEGCRVAIDTDAHHPEQLSFAELGLAAALKTGIAPERIVNFMSADDLCAWAKSVRTSRRLG